MTETEGFFIKIHQKINNSLDDVTRNNFDNLESNAKRVSYLCSLPVIKDYDLAGDVEKCQNTDILKKDMKRALQFKEEANKAVLKGDWAAAMQLYSLGMVYMPDKETEELSILFANRSAALSHLEQYEACLADIRRCLSLPYPRHLRYKVFERRARTLLILKRNQEAVRAFQDTISSLDEANKLEKEKRAKLRTDSKLMIEILNKGMVLAGNPKDPEPIIKQLPKPKLSKPNKQYPAASDAIQIDEDEIRGRFATATRDIEAGEIVVVERPHTGVLLEEFSKTHCHHCFVKCAIPLPCKKCPNTIYCSEKCLETAEKSYHGYECHILPFLWRSGCSVTCHVALRMITQYPKEYFQKLENLNANPTGPYKTNDYRNIYHLVSHENQRTKEDILHRSQMATFMVKLLELTGYFDGKPRVKPIEIEELKTMGIDDKYKEDVELFGGLILKNLQVAQFNAHEVFELQCPKPKVGQNVIKHNGKSVFLAGAVFPTLALFNHSCDPSVVRYFIGSTIIVRAVKNIKKGEEVAENYGPIFTTVPKDKRLAQLKDQYWFDCKCIPCEENWPLYDDMPTDYLRFKCDSDNPCPNVVAVPNDCQEFMVQCGLCQQYTNILKGLKSLQDTETITRLGKADMEAGKYGDAMKRFVEVLKLFDGTLSPPYQNYYTCVQDLRRCMLSLGNYSIV